MDERKVYSNLKLVVNSPREWLYFVDYCQMLLDKDHKALESASDIEAVKTIQGRISRTREMMALRDVVNNFERE